MIDFQKEPIVEHYGPGRIPRAQLLSIADVLRRGMQWNRYFIGWLAIS